MNENEPIAKPTEVQRFRRLQSALRAQTDLESFAYLVREMRTYQDVYKRFTRDIYCGKTLVLQDEVDAKVKKILNPGS